MRSDIYWHNDRLWFKRPPLGLPVEPVLTAGSRRVPCAGEGARGGEGAGEGACSSRRLPTAAHRQTDRQHACKPRVLATRCGAVIGGMGTQTGGAVTGRVRCSEWRRALCGTGDGGTVRYGGVQVQCRAVDAERQASGDPCSSRPAQAIGIPIQPTTQSARTAARRTSKEANYGPGFRHPAPPLAACTRATHIGGTTPQVPASEGLLLNKLKTLLTQSCPAFLTLLLSGTVRRLGAP